MSEEEREAEELASRPFASFANPFEDGSAARMSPRALTRYTFAALEAWARERDLGRQKGETPLEMAERLGMEVPPLDRDVERLADLYALSVYSRQEMPANSREVLERFWELLNRVTEQPLSA